MTAPIMELPPLTRNERMAAAAATVVVAVSRFAAISRGPWDWDELLFLLGLHDYDVGLHHPHPPGFPLFMLAARLLVETGVEPFRALQAINIVAAVFIVPAMLMLCRELRLPFRTSLASAILLAFFPNVWFFGGTGFSDVASVVLAIVACALLLRGARSTPALVGGSLLLAVAAGFRPQNLLLGLLPAIAASWHHVRRGRWSVVTASAIAGAAIIVISYGGAAAATGEWGRYAGAVAAHQRYLAEVDSFVSDIRPTLLQVSDDFFVRPFRFSPLNTALVILALVSCVAALARRHVPTLMAIGIFGPFWIAAWLTLDFHSASRFSIGYIPLLAILASDGLGIITAPFPRRDGVFRAGVLALVVAAIAWAWPGLSRARREWSPPMAAVRFLQSEAEDGATIFVQKRMRPFAEYYLSDRKLVHLEDEAPPETRNAFYLREGISEEPRAVNFVWPRGSLWNIARRRYFAVSVIPLAAE